MKIHATINLEVEAKDGVPYKKRVLQRRNCNDVYCNDVIKKIF